jgi:hypothetical protein
LESGYKKLIYKKLFWGIVIHAVVLWIALALGYNSYKEFMREIEPLTRAVRDSIKATFPWAILIFSGIYFFILIRKKVESAFLSVWQYVFAIGLYAVMINLLILSKGKDVFIPLHLSIFYFGILLLISTGVRRLITINLQPLSSNRLPAQDWLPPIFYRFLISNLPRIRSYIKEKPSAPFIIAFMFLLIVCAFLLIFKAEKVAEQLANIAYFSLVVGVGIELYQIVKHKNVNEDKEN